MKSMGDNRNKGSYNKNKQDVNQPGNDTNRPEEAGEKILNRKIRTRWWVRILCVLASVVVFTTVYVLILPAVAVTEHDAENSGGFYLENGETAATEMSYNGSDEDVNGVNMDADPVNAVPFEDNSTDNETDNPDQPGGFSGEDDQNQNNGNTNNDTNYGTDGDGFAGYSENDFSNPSGSPESDYDSPSVIPENNNDSLSGNTENDIDNPSWNPESNNDNETPAWTSENGDGGFSGNPGNDNDGISGSFGNDYDSTSEEPGDQDSAAHDFETQSSNGSGFSTGFPVNPDSIIGASSNQSSEEQNPDALLSNQADSQAVSVNAEPVGTEEQSGIESPVELIARYNGYDIVLSYFKTNNPGISDAVVFNVIPFDENTDEYRSVYPLLKKALEDRGRKASTIHLYQFELRDGDSVISSPNGSNITIRYAYPLSLGADETLLAVYLNPNTENATICNTLTTTEAYEGSGVVVDTASFPFLENGFVAYVTTEELTEADLPVQEQEEGQEQDQDQDVKEEEGDLTQGQDQNQDQEEDQDQKEDPTQVQDQNQEDDLIQGQDQNQDQEEDQNQEEDLTQGQNPDQEKEDLTQDQNPDQEKENLTQDQNPDQEKEDLTQGQEQDQKEDLTQGQEQNQEQDEENKPQDGDVAQSTDAQSDVTQPETTESGKKRSEETKSEETESKITTSEEIQSEENKSEEDSTLKITGGTTVKLTEVAPEIGIDNVRNVRSIDVEGSDYIQVTKESGSRDWKIESVLPEENSDVEIKDETAELSIKQRDGSVSKTTIEISGEQTMNLTDEGAENNQVVVSSADGKYLPEEAQGTARTLTEEEGSDAVDRVKEYTADDDTVDRTIEQKKSGKRKIKVKKKCYKVFDISLENVNQDDYDQFTVSMDLQESITGTDFKLYHIHDDEVKPLDVKMTSSDTDKSGQDVVSAIEFETPNFSQFVLTYTVEEEVEVTTYTYHTDEDQFDAAATIAGVAADTAVVYAESESEGLVVSEEKPAVDAEAPAVHFIVTLENGFEDGYLLLETADEEFYEILVVKNTGTIISAANENYSVTIDFGDSLPKGKYEIGINQYPAGEKQISLIEEALTEDLGDGKKKIAHVHDVELLDIKIVEINEEAGTRAEVEPHGPVKVTLQKGTETLPTVVHFIEGEEGEDKVELLEVEEGNTFVTNSFSTFTGSYTVDFEYTDEENGKKTTWKWSGKGSYKIADIMAEIGVTGEISDVSLVRTVDEGGSDNVLYLEEKDDGWYLISDEAFQDTFELTVVIDGKTYVVVVTDAPKTGYTDLESLADNITVNVIDAEHNAMNGSVIKTTTVLNADIAYYITNNISAYNALVAEALAPGADGIVRIDYDMTALIDAHDTLTDLKGSGDLHNDSHVVIGTFTTENGHILIHLDATKLDKNTTTARGSFAIRMTIDRRELINGGSEQFQFPGSSDTLTINWPGYAHAVGTKSVNKNSDTVYTAEDVNEYLEYDYTLTITGGLGLDELKLTDYLPAGMELKGNINIERSYNTLTQTSSRVKYGDNSYGAWEQWTDNSTTSNITTAVVTPETADGTMTVDVLNALGLSEADTRTTPVENAEGTERTRTETSSIYTVSYTGRIKKSDALAQIPDGASVAYLTNSAKWNQTSTPIDGGSTTVTINKGVLSPGQKAVDGVSSNNIQATLSDFVNINGTNYYIVSYTVSINEPIDATAAVLTDTLSQYQSLYNGNAAKLLINGTQISTVNLIATGADNGKGGTITFDLQSTLQTLNPQQSFTKNTMYSLKYDTLVAVEDFGKEITNATDWTINNTPVDGEDRTVVIKRMPYEQGQKWDALVDNHVVGSGPWEIPWVIKTFQHQSATEVTLTDSFSSDQQLKDDSFVLWIGNTSYPIPAAASYLHIDNINHGFTIDIDDAIKALTGNNTNPSFVAETEYKVTYTTLTSRYDSNTSEQEKSDNTSQWTFDETSDNPVTDDVILFKDKYSPGQKLVKSEEGSAIGSSWTTDGEAWVEYTTINKDDQKIDLSYKITLTEPMDGVSQATLTDIYSNLETVDFNSMKITVDGTEYAVLSNEITQYGRTFSIDFVAVMRRVLIDNAYTIEKNKSYVLTYNTSIPLSDDIKNLLKQTDGNDQLIGLTVPNQQSWHFNGPNGEHDNPGNEVEYTFKEKPYSGGNKTVAVWNSEEKDWMETTLYNNGTIQRYVDTETNRLYYTITLKEDRNVNKAVIKDTYYGNQTLDINSFTVTFMENEQEVTLTIPSAIITTTDVANDGKEFEFDLVSVLGTDHPFTPGVTYSIKYEADAILNNDGNGGTPEYGDFYNSAEWTFDDGDGYGTGGSVDEHLVIPDFVPGTKSVSVRESVKTWDEYNKNEPSDWSYWYNHSNPENITHTDFRKTISNVISDGPYHLDYTITIQEPRPITSAVVTDTFKGSATQTIDQTKPFTMSIDGKNEIEIPWDYIDTTSPSTGFSLRFTDFLGSIRKEFEKNIRYEIHYTTTTTVYGNTTGSGDGQDNRADWTLNNEPGIHGGHTEVHIKKVPAVEKTYFNAGGTEQGAVNFGERVKYVVTVGSEGDKLNGYYLSDYMTTYHHFDSSEGLKIYSGYETNNPILMTTLTTNGTNSDGWNFCLQKRSNWYESKDLVFDITFPDNNHTEIYGPITLVYEALMGTKEDTGIRGSKTIYNTVSNNDVEITTHFDVTAGTVSIRKTALPIDNDILEPYNVKAWWSIEVIPEGMSLNGLYLRDVNARLNIISMDNLKPGENNGDTGSEYMSVDGNSLTVVYKNDSVSPMPGEEGGHQAGDPVDSSLYEWTDLGYNAIRFKGDISEPIEVRLATKTSNTYKGGNIYLTNTVRITDNNWKDMGEPSTATKEHEEEGSVSAVKSYEGYVYNEDGPSVVNWRITINTTGTSTLTNYRLDENLLKFSHVSLEDAKTNNTYDSNLNFDWNYNSVVIRDNLGGSLTKGTDYRIDNGGILFLKPLTGQVTVDIPTTLKLVSGVTYVYNKATMYDRDGGETLLEADGRIENYTLKVDKTIESNQDSLPKGPDFNQEVSYKVTVNSDKGEYPEGKVVITDVLPPGMEFVDNDSYGYVWTNASYQSERYFHYEDYAIWATLKPVVTTNILDDGRTQQTLTVDFSKTKTNHKKDFTLNGYQLEFIYKARLTEAERTRLKNLGTNVPQVYLNDVIVVQGDTVEGHDDVSWDYTWDNGLDKQDITNDYFGDNAHNPYLYYRIIINPEGRRMNNGYGLVLTDCIDTAMELNLPSVQVYKYENNIPIDATNDEDVRISYDGITRVLTVRVPDEKKYVVEFDAVIENAYEGMVKTFTNTANLEGESHWEDTVIEEHRVMTVAGVFDYEIERGFIVKKVDGNNITLPLEGAEFTLYKATFPALSNLDAVYRDYANYDNDKNEVHYDLSPFVLSGQDTSFDPVVVTTDGTKDKPPGMAKFSNLNLNELYYWVETKTPPGGYSAGLFAEPQYVILFTNNETVNPNSYAQAKLLDHLISDANGIIVNTAKESYEWIATNVKETQYKVTKIWQDNNNVAGKRPSSIWVQLKQDGVNYDNPETAEINEGLVEITPNNVGTWEYIWYDLPATRASGESYVYSAEELTPVHMAVAGLITSAQATELTAQLEDYTTLYKDVAGGVEITNRMRDETSLLVNKTWDDDNNVSRLRPGFIEVILYRETLTSSTPSEVGTVVRMIPTSNTDNTVVVGTSTSTIKIYANDGWIAEFNGLITEDGDTTYRYYLVEVPVEGYETSYSTTMALTSGTAGSESAGIADSNGIITINNKLDIVRATKKWLDFNGNETWTADVRFKLVKILASGDFDYNIGVPSYYNNDTHSTEWSQTIVSDTNHRSAIWRHLDPLEEGQSYFAVEDGIVLPAGTVLTGDTIVKDGNGSRTLSSGSLTEDTELFITRNTHGAAMSFTLNGVSYDVTGGMSTSGTCTIVNAPKVEREFVKTWEGMNVEELSKYKILIQLRRKSRTTGQYDATFNNDADRFPEGQVIELTAAKSGTTYTVGSSEVPGNGSNSTTWIYRWSNLPLTHWSAENAESVEYIYEVNELGIYCDGVEVTDRFDVICTDDMSITNKPHNYISLNVKKQWDDNNNASGIRPASVTVQLYSSMNNYAEPMIGKDIVLTAANNWQGVWTYLDDQYTYKVQESSVLGSYAVTYSPVDGVYAVNEGKNHDGDTVTITNTRTNPEIGSLELKKYWEDDKGSVVTEGLPDRGAEFELNGIPSDPDSCGSGDVTVHIRHDYNCHSLDNTLITLSASEGGTVTLSYSVPEISGTKLKIDRLQVYKKSLNSWSDITVNSLTLVKDTDEVQVFSIAIPSEFESSKIVSIITDAYLYDSSKKDAVADALRKSVNINGDRNTYPQRLTLSKSNDWYASVSGLDPEHNTYTLKEILPDDAEYSPIRYVVNGTNVTPDGSGLVNVSTGTVIVTNKIRGLTGSVQVTKEFTGIQESQVPNDFKITASWTDGNEKTTVLKATGDSPEGVTRTGQFPNYTWEISDLPLGTEVTFTESGYDVNGYKITVTGSATSADKTTASAIAAVVPGKASFVNTYTTPAKTEIHVTKAWNLNGTNVSDPGDNIDKITFKLWRKKGSETEVISNVSGYPAVTEGAIAFSISKTEGGWSTADIYNLPKYDTDGNTFTYYVVEDGVYAGDKEISGWTASYKSASTSEELGSAQSIVTKTVSASAISGGYIKIINSKSTVALPSTGGLGTKFYYLFGLLMLALAGFGVAVMRKRKA